MQSQVRLEENIPNDKMKISNYSNASQSMLKGIFLIVLGVCGNFVAETLGCKTQKLLSENMFAKQFIILLIVYFAIDFTTSDKPIHPLENMKLSLFIWIIYLIFTKMSIGFTILLFLLLTGLYVLSTFVTYYDSIENNEQYKPFISAFNNNITNILYIFCAIVVIGFGLYFNKQYKEHQKNWSTITFFFGKPSCDSLK